MGDKIIKWSDEKTKELYKLYVVNGKSRKEIAMIMNMPINRIHNKIIFEGFKKGDPIKSNPIKKTKKRVNSWTKHEDDILLKYYPDKNIPITKISKKINRTAKAITDRAYVLNLTRTETGCVSVSNYNYIVKNYSFVSTAKLSYETNLPVHTIYRIAKENNIFKNKAKTSKKQHKSKKQSWSKEDEKFLILNSETKTLHYMCKELGRSYNSVRGKLSHLGLSEKRLKIYSAGGVKFTYNDLYERQQKIEYVIMIKQLLNNRGMIGIEHGCGFRIKNSLREDGFTKQKKYGTTINAEKRRLGA